MRTSRGAMVVSVMLLLGSAASLAAAARPKPGVPVAWGGDHRRFFPLSPGNTWTFHGRNTRVPESFEFTWQVLRRSMAPDGSMIYAVEVVRNGEMRPGFYFSADSTGLYRRDAPTAVGSLVLPFPAVAGQSWGGSERREPFEIVGVTDVTTPAGLFRGAIKVRSQETGKRGDPFWTSAYDYYAPGVGRIKSENLTHRDGKTDTLRTELVGYAVQTD